MGINKKYKDTYYYSSANSIPKETWEQLSSVSNIYFSPNYLEALEENHPEILFSYIVLVDDAQEAIALATIVEANTGTIVSSVSGEVGNVVGVLTLLWPVGGLKKSSSSILVACTLTVALLLLLSLLLLLLLLSLLSPLLLLRLLLLLSLLLLL